MPDDQYFRRMGIEYRSDPEPTWYEKLCIGWCLALMCGLLAGIVLWAMVR